MESELVNFFGSFDNSVPNQSIHVLHFQSALKRIFRNHVFKLNALGAPDAFDAPMQI